MWFGIQTFCSGYFHSLLLTAFILLAWRQGVAVARGKAAKGRFVSVYIFIFGFTKVQLTERIFVIYNFKENRCLWNKDSPHFKTSSVRAAALEKLTTLLDHKTVEQNEMLRPCSHVE